MFEFLASNLPTIIAGIIVFGILFAIVYKMIKDKKSGKSSCSCSGCSGCPSGGKCGHS